MQSVLSATSRIREPEIMDDPAVVLDRLQQDNAPRPCVALAFGPGLVAEATLFV